MIKIDAKPTKKEIELVQMVADDIPTKKIAEQKEWALRTAETYIENLRKKYQCRTRVGLVMLFLHNKLIK